jgi:hypothetical protein
MVDHVYDDPATEPAWHDWYAGYLQKLVAVPGIDSAQRFRALGFSPPRYLAMYSVASPDVYESDAYRNMGGGGSQSARFHHAYRLWTRNLFDGASHAPIVRDGQRVLVFDRKHRPEKDAVLRPRDHPSCASRRYISADAALARATWLEAVGLHMTTRYRAFLVLDANESVSTACVAGSYLYEPFTPVLLSRES